MAQKCGPVWTEPHPIWMLARTVWTVIPKKLESDLPAVWTLPNNIRVLKLYNMLLSVPHSLYPCRMSTTTFLLRKSIKSKRSWRRRGARGYRSRSWTRRRWLGRGRRSPASPRPTPLAHGHRVRIRTGSNKPFCKSNIVHVLWVP